MKAAIYQGPSKAWPAQPITVEDIPIPIPGQNDVLVKVAACGLCHTDLTYLHGNPTPKKPPIILGHEPSGVVVQVGSKVQSVNCGDNVIVSCFIPCLVCDQCRSGHENLCANATIPGATQDGAFAEYLVVPASGVCSVPNGLPVEECCIISDAVCTAYHAIYQIANARPGDNVAIYGASGGVGLLCVQFASLIGTNVIGIGRKKQKLDVAKEFGASEIICIEEIDNLGKTVKRVTNGGADISVDATGIPGMIETACRATRPGGKIVIVGFSFEKVSLELNRLLWQELNIIGSKNFNPTDIPKVFKLVEKGYIKIDKMISHRFKLEQINEALLTLERGEMLRGIVVP